MLKILQVGAGGWGSSWLKFIQESPEWELAGLVSRGGEHVEKLRVQYSLPPDRIFPDIQTGLQADADAVLITTPHRLHAPMSKLALQAGKHVLCEKPLSDSMEEAKEMVACAKQHGRLLMVNQNFRFRPRLWQMKRALRQLGAVDQVRVELYQPAGAWPAWRYEQVSPLILEVMIHHVDMARFLLDANARQVACHAWSPRWSACKNPVAASAWIEFENDVRMTYCASWAASGRKTGWEGAWNVLCERGAILWSADSLQILDENGNALDIDEVPEFPGVDRLGILKEFASAIRENRCPLTNGEDNLYSLGIISAAIMSFQRGEPISVPDLLK